MQAEINDYRAKLADLVTEWKYQGLPSREGLEKKALELFNWKDRTGIKGIWSARPPLMVTATLDDGIGQGLQLIHLFAAAIGMPTYFLGLFQNPQFIIETCRNFRSEYLGLTVLQFDSEETVSEIVSGLGGQTCIIAGGPVFRLDTGFAERTGVNVVAGSAADFIEFCLKTERPPSARQWAS